MDRSVAFEDAAGAVVLCGGRSSRFGADKALVRLSGRTFLERAIDAARPVASEIVLAVGEEPRYVEAGFPLVIDEAPSRGPLSGIVAGLEALSIPRFLIVAVDLPLVTPEALRELLRHLPGHDLVMPRSPGGWQPLLCAGVTAPCLAAARTLLESATPAPYALAESVRTRALSASPGDGTALGRALQGVNTPEELEEARRALAAHRE
jgi:molybdopterin-guanine dinucleotide biosynthesis protein A